MNREINPETIERGMDVIDADGEKIGVVSEIWNPHSDGSAFRDGDVRGDRYIQVEEGDLLGSRSLYVPFTEVASVSPGMALYLRCSRTEAEARYT
jgi:hypothetical protein